MQIIPWLESTQILVENTPNFNLTDAEEEQIAFIWEQEKKRCEGNLFNGEIFHVVEVSSKIIKGYFIEYRFLVAFQRDPIWRKRLDLHTLGISGIVINPSGDILFGKRALWTLTFGGLYELVPSGGVDPIAREGSVLHIQKQFNLELQEETGIESSQILKIIPECILLKKEENITEVIGKIYLKTNIVPNPTIEYPELFWVKQSELASFLETNQQQILPFTIDILKSLCYL